MTGWLYYEKFTVTGECIQRYAGYAIICSASTADCIGKRLRALREDARIEKLRGWRVWLQTDEIDTRKITLAQWGKVK